MIKRLCALLLVPTLAGCPALDVIEGKPSPYKEHVERVALVVVEPAEVELEPVTVMAEPAEEPAPPPMPVIKPEPTKEPEPMPVDPPPECTSDTFRVSRCVDGKIQPW